ncbi:MAG: phosphotransferase family protein [Desulfatibacillaceae bacterium]|nr:phosphotransferase family protein [Desulfatibacillaceae bacterium]
MTQADLTDKPKQTREGEQLDAAKVEQFLKDSIKGLSGQLSINQFPSGHSNLTYLVSVGDKQLVLRRPPFGKKAKTAHDMGREFRILSALHPVFPYCPKPLAYTDDPAVMGCPFYVMERISGIILRKDLPKGLALDPKQAAALCKELMDIHISLHKLDYKAIGLEDFGKPVGYVDRQVDGWSRRYRDARTPDAPDFEDIMAWLDKNRPVGQARAAVIHGDYKFDNVVLDPANPLKIIGVLDWEMATIGDPLMDLGCSLAYWVQKGDPAEVEQIRMMPTNIDGAMTRRELVDYYRQQTGLAIDNWPFYFTFGLFRLAVIAQQIYYRFYHGQTKDNRFAMMIFAVHILEKAAQQAAEQKF